MTTTHLQHVRTDDRQLHAALEGRGYGLVVEDEYL